MTIALAIKWRLDSHFIAFNVSQIGYGFQLKESISLKILFDSYKDDQDGDDQGVSLLKSYLAKTWYITYLT